MRYALHLVILLASLVAGTMCLLSALKGESGWYGVIVAGIVFGFAAGNLTLLEIRNWVRATGHRQHSRLLRLLAAPVTRLETSRIDEDTMISDDTEGHRIGNHSQALLPSREEPTHE
ncbi:MAG: hypothetical protein MI757_00150 [Pirellulales bacterium]|nr:hypothetical protein [Pirellulales bacterium]